MRFFQSAFISAGLATSSTVTRFDKGVPQSRRATTLAFMLVLHESVGCKWGSTGHQTAKWLIRGGRESVAYVPSSGVLGEGLAGGRASLFSSTGESLVSVPGAHADGGGYAAAVRMA